LRRWPRRRSRPQGPTEDDADQARGRRPEPAPRATADDEILPEQPFEDASLEAIGREAGLWEVVEWHWRLLVGLEALSAAHRAPPRPRRSRSARRAVNNRLFDVPAGICNMVAISTWV